MTPRDARTARNVASPTATSARTTAMDDEVTLSVAPPSVVVITNDLVDDRNPRAATGVSAVSTAAIEVMNKFNDLTTCAKIDTSTSIDDSCALPVLCKPVKLARVARQLSVEDDASCDETAVNTSNEDNLDEIGVVLATGGDRGPPVNVGVAAPLLEHQAPSPRSRRDAPSGNTKSTRKCEDEKFCDIARMLSGDDGDTVPRHRSIRL
ncbi:hypothetical protein THAOC_20484 [Thalassiosira oceanica]|uniref:Uncharacterized protein n=1 Tax=Thalassiosira oceanica TaxID=159749 RepID=K0SLF6_THAOC|nr:hypothetical protein THAOC_20484 [Thalassiosira oceanica]|eukprot:EJK59312.1 hypothetical protein THAOC_20484 [Thalassiosira oceanica]